MNWIDSSSQEDLHLFQSYTHPIYQIVFEYVWKCLKLYVRVCVHLRINTKLIGFIWNIEKEQYHNHV